MVALEYVLRDSIQRTIEAKATTLVGSANYRSNESSRDPALVRVLLCPCRAWMTGSELVFLAYEQYNVAVEASTSRCSQHVKVTSVRVPANETRLRDHDVGLA
jgi:hypothetical protein